MTTEQQAIREFLEAFGVTRGRQPQVMTLRLQDNNGNTSEEWIYNDYAPDQYTALERLWEIAHDEALQAAKGVGDES
jgi:hypothetical protein